VGVVPVIAVLLAAMMIHGVKPGPMLMIENPSFVYDVVAMNVYATLGILFFGLFLVRPLLKVTSLVNDGVTLAPDDARAKQFAAFASGVVYRRAWNLESTARAAVDFVNNHPAGQLTATFDGEQDV
jgi:hypothetical protein